jgi:hypothetical protein
MAFIQIWRDAAFLKGDVEIEKRSVDEAGRWREWLLNNNSFLSVPSVSLWFYLESPINFPIA